MRQANGKVANKAAAAARNQCTGRGVVSLDDAGSPGALGGMAMNGGPKEPSRPSRLPSYPLTVGAFSALVVLSFVMAAIHAGA